MRCWNTKLYSRWANINLRLAIQNVSMITLFSCQNMQLWRIFLKFTYRVQKPSWIYNFLFDYSKPIRMKEYVRIRFEYLHSFEESKYCYQFWKGFTNMIKAFQLSWIYLLSSYCHHGKTNVLYYRPMYSPPETRCHQKIMFFLVLVFSYLRFNVPNEQMDTIHFNKRCAEPSKFCNIIPYLKT